MSKHSERRLSREQQAFWSEVYADYYHSVFVQFLRRVGDEFTAEDLTQTVLGDLFPQKLKDGKAPDTKGPRLTAWFAKTVKLTALDFYGKKGRYFARFEEDLSVSSPNEEGETSSTSKIDNTPVYDTTLEVLVTYEALAKLPEKYREVIRAFMYDEPDESVAGRLNIALGTVKIYRANARNLLLADGISLVTRAP